jgi:hypothetical protein
VAGAPFFFGEGEPDGDSFGVPLASGLGLGLADSAGVSPGEGLGVGDVLRFFFLLTLGEASGDGVGEDFFFFAEADGLGEGVSEGVAVADAFFFFVEGEELGAGVSEAVGEAVAFFFGVADLAADEVDFFFFRGAGVGDGAKIFFNVVPIDSSAGADGTKPARTARTPTATIVSILRRMGIAAITFSPVRRARLCSAECRLRDFRAENSR